MSCGAGFDARNPRQRWQVYTRSMKCSRSPGSCKRPSSSTGSNGSRAIRVRANTPRPLRRGLPDEPYTLIPLMPHDGEFFFRM